MGDNEYILSQFCSIIFHTKVANPCIIGSSKYRRIKGVIKFFVIVFLIIGVIVRDAKYFAALVMYGVAHAAIVSNPKAFICRVFSANSQLSN